MKKSFRNRLKRENILKHLNDRSLGRYCSKPSSIENLEKHLPYFWKKRTIETEKHNKIFASQWVNNDHVVYGTKCNKLYWLNVNKGTSYEIPLIEGVQRKDQLNVQTNEPSTNFGVHAIKKNYSETLLATGAENVNSVGVYKLPEFQPMAILENFHSDAIFDICWLDDSHVATCSRDAKMGIWCVNPDLLRPHKYYYNRCSFINNHCDVNDNMINVYNKPVTQICLNSTGHRFRAMEYLQATNKLLIATMSNKLYSIDPSRDMSDDCSSLIPFKTSIQEMVAIRKWPIEPQSYAVGGQARFAIYDSRSRDESLNIVALNQSAGIRSLAFKDFVISYGTAEGHINFFDIRAMRHVTVNSGQHHHHHHHHNNHWTVDHTNTDVCASVSGGASSSSARVSCPPYTPYPWSRINHNNNILQLQMEGIFEPISDLFGGRLLSSANNQTAIYTHEYDPTRSRLFAAGGPIAACHIGQAACLFE